MTRAIAPHPPEGIVQPPYTAEEYLEREVRADRRHEYIDGEIVPMAGSSFDHNRIVLNLAGALNFSLPYPPYDVFAENIRLWIPKKRFFTYPDIAIARGELQLYEGRNDTMTNPLLIAEVLSRSTRSYDKDEKFAAYRTIPSFREYLLIDQYAPHVEQYVKTDGGKWTFCEYDGTDATLVLETVPFKTSLADLYKKVDFTAETPDAESEETPAEIPANETTSEEA